MHLHLLNERRVFWATVLVAGAIVWIAPRPPMSDLAQHAGQIALWHDLLSHSSKWSPLLQINYFTPYLVGYGTALLISFVLPVAAALKVVLSLAFLGLIAACVALRRQFGGDSRLDWLFVPGFFGYAYIWGFYTFLIAAPLGVLFVLLAEHFSARPTVGAGIVLLLAEIVLFIAHGFVFLFANAIGASFLIVRFKGWTRLVASTAPYVVAALLCLLYAAVRLPQELGQNADLFGIDWGWDINRLKFVIFPFGAFKADAYFGVLSLLMLAAPFLLGARINSANKAALLPFALTLVVWLCVPFDAYGTAHIYQRFAVFLLPFYALMFRAPNPQPSRDLYVRAVLPLACWVFVGTQIARHAAFANESRAFDTVLEKAAPGFRALAVILDPASAATGNLVAYAQFPLWYQAEKQGLVDFNSAVYPPQVVRYKPQSMPAITTGTGWLAGNFSWERDQAGIYRYFFVRTTQPLPATFYPVGKCRPDLVASQGAWSLYENVNCFVSPPPGPS